MKYVLLTFLLLTPMAVYFVMRQRLPLKLKRFENRERFSLERIHDDFYPGYELGTFVELWQEIASAVEVPPGLIRPTDRFDSELGPVKGFRIAGEMDDLEEACIRRCGQKQIDFHKLRIETVDDYIRQFG